MYLNIEKEKGKYREKKRIVWWKVMQYLRIERKKSCTIWHCTMSKEIACGI